MNSLVVAHGPIRGLALFLALAFFISLFNYFWTSNGIHGTEGALLVVVSAALLAVATAGMLVGWIRGAWRAVVEVLIFLDFLGSGFAAYLLEAWLLVGVLGLAFVFWVLHLLADRSAVRP